MKSIFRAEQAIRLTDYLYELPGERIAAVPLPERDQAKLLVYRQGTIMHGHFYELSQYISPDTLLVFNDTKVIPARLYFRRITGGLLEIFLLSPEPMERSIHQVMQQQESCSWKCLIGNKKRWKEGESLRAAMQLPDGLLSVEATLIDHDNQIVRFDWQPGEIPFSAVIGYLGEIPLPPYLNRQVTEQDKVQYQTVYSRKEGAVAAPTAGLHFTPSVMQSLRDKGVITEFLTLHVGAGTFQPIKADNVLQHPMHAEQLVVTRQNLESLLSRPDRIFAVGTTSTRTLESLYWYGVKLLSGEKPAHLFIEKLYPYSHSGETLPDTKTSFQAIYEHLLACGLEEITGETEILITPGYSFRVCKGILTNFHQPGSTLILLIAAFIGEDWRKVYHEALQKDYRFLSYGDSSLLMP